MNSADESESSAISRHVWGVSESVDRVWALVSGMRSSRAGCAAIMVFQAFLDESVSAPGDDFLIIAGHIATAENWAKFSVEWERLLPWAKLGSSGERRFKLSEMGRSEQDNERVAAFYRVIENHVACSISSTIRLSHLENAKRRVMIPGRRLNWGLLGNPYVIAFKSLMDQFNFNRHLLTPAIPEDARVDFIFDNRSEKSKLLPAWDEYVANLDGPLRARMGISPKFEDEEVFLPLQAADLWAGSLRRWAESQLAGTPPEGVVNLIAKRQLPIMNIMMTEDQMVMNILMAARNDIPNVVTYDLDLAVPRPWQPTSDQNMNRAIDGHKN